MTTETTQQAWNADHSADWHQGWNQGWQAHEKRLKMSEAVEAGHYEFISKADLRDLCLGIAGMVFAFAAAGRKMEVTELTAMVDKMIGELK